MSTFEVPKSKASIKQNRFEFKMPDGNKFSLPLLEFIKPSLALKLAELEVVTAEDGSQTTDMQATTGLVALIFETYFPGQKLFEQFDDAEQFAAWMQAWTDASGATLGKSEASQES